MTLLANSPSLVRMQQAFRILVEATDAEQAQLTDTPEGTMSKTVWPPCESSLVQR